MDQQERDISRSLPIAEDFHSLQGEGRWAGTAMHFIRLAGCSVGKLPLPAPLETFPILKTGTPAWECHTYDGRAFWCDTDFKFREWKTFDSLLADTWEHHICLTGGEPLMHMEKLVAFIEEANVRDIMVHIETSGTIEYFPRYGFVWVSVSPKYNATSKMIAAANEIKLLVDEYFNLAAVPQEVLDHQEVYVQPINLENDIDWANVTRCKDLLRMMPDWHLSLQLHKVLRIR